MCDSMRREILRVVALLLASFAKGSLSASRNATSCDWNNPPISPDCPISQAELDYMADNLVVQVSSVDNLKDDGNTHIMQIRLHNNGTRVMRGKAWELFFHSFFMVEPDHLPQEAFIDDDYKVKYEHVTGSLFSLSPAEGFHDILPNNTRTIEHEAKNWAVSKSDFLPNWYLKASNLEPRLIKSTNSSQFAGDISSAKQWKRFKYDRYNPFTSQDRYERFYTLYAFTNGPSVIPKPKNFFESRSFGEFTVDETWTIGATKGTRKMAKLLSSELDLPIKDLINGRSISLRLIDNNEGPEWYAIESNINAPSIVIFANSQAGLFYGVQTLVSLLDRFKHTRTKSLFPFYLEDEPRFEYRGLRLDVVRHFRNKEEVKRLIDLMSMYKLNKLDLMLSNDEGWRIDIPSFPELVQVGARRCHDIDETECLLPQIGNPISSPPEYYTAEDYIEILQHAKERNVEVIPEINFPGHAYAIKRAIESRFKNSNRTLWSPPEEAPISVQMFKDNMLNPCSDMTYELLKTVLNQIAAYHMQAGTPLKNFHTGGDDHYSMDRWVNSEDCVKRNMRSAQAIQNMFDDRVSRLIEGVGANVSGFADGFMNEEGAPQDPRLFRTPEVTAHYWNNDFTADFSNVYQLANAGYKVVLGPVSHLYFDHPYEPNPEENGLYWATRFTDTRKVFSFEPENIYRAIQVKKTGETIEQRELCGRYRERCPPIQRPQNIKGMEGSMYGELIRSQDMMDYMLFPRLLGLAERAWHKGAWEDIEEENKRKIAMNDDWQRFARIVGSKELQRLDDLGVMYRISPAGAKSDGIKRMYTNTEFPNQIVEYSTNSGEKWRRVPKDWLMKSYNSRILVRAVPKVGRIKANTDHLTERMEYSVNQGKTWRLVPDTWPIASYNPILLRTRSADGKRLSRETEFDPRGINPIPNQADVEKIAKSLRVTYELEDNLVDQENSFLFRVTLHNTGNETLTYGNYSIYMYNIRLLQPNQSPYPNGYKLHDCSLWLHHVGGSLYRLDPEQPDFKIPPGQSLSCLISGKNWQVSRTDSMPNWFVGAEGMDPVVIGNTVSEDLNYVSKFDTSNKWKRYPDDQYNPYSPPTRYGIHKDIADRGLAIKPLIPSPKNLQINRNREVLIGGRSNGLWFIQSDGNFPTAARDLADHFRLQINANRPRGSNVIQLEKTEEIRNREGYSINVDPISNKITLKSRDDPGMFYAVQTLKALAEEEGDVFVLPEVNGYDEPRFPYRGMHLDVARNFQPKEEVMKLLDLMAKYKLNKLHLHLTDDEGWRIEVPQLPELTQIGSQRCFDLDEEECILPQIGSAPLRPNTGTGYYTAEDYRDILRYAADRHIEIIPEVNTPGHSRAAIVAMENRYKRFMKSENEDEAKRFLLSDMDDTSYFLSRQTYKNNVMSPCLPTTFDFLEVVAQTLYVMHQDIQPLQTMHFGGPGGDDLSSNVWNNSKACQELRDTLGFNIAADDLKSHFVDSLAQKLPPEVTLAVWEDALLDEKRPLYRFGKNLGKRDVIGYAWDNIWEHGNGDNAHILANNDYKVVVSHATDLFFDHPSEPDPEERGYYWATRFTNTRKVFGFTPARLLDNAQVSRKGIPLTREDMCPEFGCVELTEPSNVIGMQGQLWTETMRYPDQLEYMAAPRILALAERAWHKADWEDIDDKITRDRARDRDWEEFANTLAYRELAKLDKMNFRYRIPPPGAEIKNQVLHTNSEIPGLPIEISLDNKRTWRRLNGELPVTDNKLIHLRTTSPDGRRYSRIVTVTPAITNADDNSVYRMVFLDRFLKYLGLSLIQ